MLEDTDSQALGGGNLGAAPGRLENIQRRLTEVLLELEDLQSLRAAAYLSMALDALTIG